MVVVDARSILWGALKDKVRSKIRGILMWLALFGPVAWVFADRIAHFFGICLGH